MYRYSKYHAQRTYSETWERYFDSKAECQRAKELYLLQRAGEISDLEFQVSYKLCDKPNIKIKIDFRYKEDGKVVHEDVKGMGETREFRVKRAWLKQLHGIDIVLNRRTWR